MDEQDYSRRQPSSMSGVIPFRRTGTQLVPTNQPVEQQEPERTRQFNPLEFINMLVRRVWVIVGVMAIVLVGTVGWVIAQKPMYLAASTVEVKPQQTRIVDSGAVTPAIVADSDHMATQHALLRSRALAERVAETLDLPSNPLFANPEGSRAERLRQATDVISRGLQIRPVQRSRVIEISFSSSSPEEAARIANAIAENYVRSDIERRFNATAYARTFLEERLQSTKAALEDAERKLVAYSRQQRIIDLSSNGGSQNGGSLDASALIALSSSLTDAQQERITAQQIFLSARDDANTRKTLSNDAIKLLNEARVKLSTEYQEKLRTYKPDFPEMRDLAARIAATDREIEIEQGRVLAGLEAAAKSAAAREAALQKRVDELRGEVQDVQARSIDYNILSREVDTLRSQYEALLQRFKDVSIVSGINESQVALVDRAETPKSPYSPNIRNALILSFVMSLALGIGLGLLLDYADDTIKNPDDVKNKLGLPVLGVVPKVGASQSVVELMEDPRSAISEAFGSARTALQFSSQSGVPRTLLITGNRPSEGKTSTATGLALSFSRIGKRVLVIDADMRRPSFAADPGSSIGLSGLLTREASALDNIVQGKVENVDLLPAGISPPNPAEILAGGRFSRVLEEVAPHYDLIVVDAPPVLDFADAPLLSSFTDATVMVVQAGAVRTPNARRTMERLLAANAHIIGVILTKFDLKRTGYGYSYDYAYQYGGYGQTKDGVQTEANAKRRIGIFTSGKRPDDTGDVDEKSA
jgi:polysaccharide biosynthesis transport protein